MNNFIISGLGALINRQNAVNKNYADELFSYFRRHLIQIGGLNEKEILSASDVFRLIRKESGTGSEIQPESQPTSNVN